MARQAAHRGVELAQARRASKGSAAGAAPTASGAQAVDTARIRPTGGETRSESEHRERAKPPPRQYRLRRYGG
eukprot:1316744-Alexandrium_andersonii.AAC.1